MNDTQIQACLQLLKDVPEEPDWAKIENNVMKSISVSGRKTASVRHRAFLPAVLAAICLMFWGILAADISGEPPQNLENREHLTVLSIQEQRIVMKYPETAMLVHDIKPVKSGYDLNEFMAKRHSFLKRN